MAKSNIVKKWTEYGTKHLVGRTIKKVRYLTDAEVRDLCWCESCLVMELDDGTMVFPSRDDEGNGGGALFGQGPKGEQLTFPVIW